MTPRISVCAVLLLAVIAAGCLQTNETYTVNPDGSGKVTIESTVEDLGFGMMDTKKPSAKQQVQRFVSDVVDGSSGVTVWKDISCKSVGEGKTWFKGTAYFDDISELNLKNISGNTFQVERGADGTMKLIYGKESEEPETAQPVELTEEQLAIRIDSAKQSFEASMGMMRPVFGGIKTVTTVRTSGALESAEGFIRNADGSATITFSGKRVMEMMDSVTKQPNFWREQVLAEAKGNTQEMNRRMRKSLFGYDRPAVALKTTGAPAFDYKAEVAAAKKGYTAMLKKFGVKPSGN